MFIEKAHKSETVQHSGRHGLIHVARSGIPPGTTTVVGGDSCPRKIQTILAELPQTRAWTFPLSPKNTTQLPTYPRIQFSQDPFDLDQPEVSDPAT